MTCSMEEMKQSYLRNGTVQEPMLPAPFLQFGRGEQVDFSYSGASKKKITEMYPE